MSLKKLIAIVIHVNANLVQIITPYIEITVNHLPLYCEVLKMTTILVANPAVYWQFLNTEESKSHDASSYCM